MEKAFDKFEINLSSFFKLMMKKGQEILCGYEISFLQYYILIKLDEVTKLQMSDISKEISSSKPAATHNIDQLTASGFVKRCRGIDDRRIIWIEITEVGRDLIKEIRKKRKTFLGSLFQKLSPSDQKGAARIFEQFISNSQ